MNSAGTPRFSVALLFEDGSQLLYVTRDRALDLQPGHGGAKTDSSIIDLNGIRALVREPGQKEIMEGDPSWGINHYPGLVNWFEETVEIALMGEYPAADLIRLARTIAGSA